MKGCGGMSISEAIKTVSEPINKLLVPVSSSAGSTLQDAWELVFGGFGNYVEKKRIVRMKALEDFKESLERKVADIPENQLCEPALSIVGPALEASKYYFEEPELREMFAKLISASMDSTKSQSVHPSFTEIIRQLSPLDAQNLACFVAPDGSFDRLPIVEYRIKNVPKRSYNVFQTNSFLSNPKEQSLTRQAVSIAVLARLGLVQVTFNAYLTTEALYKPFEQTDEYRVLTDYCSKQEGKALDLAKGEAFLTPVGEVFCSICLPTKSS